MPYVTSRDGWFRDIKITTESEIWHLGLNIVQCVLYNTLDFTFLWDRGNTN